MSLEPSSGVQLVWFKRDLRLADHRPLLEASRRGPVLCLYVYEPEVIQGPEFDGSHLRFLNESLAELDAKLRARGGQLVLRYGSLPEVFEEWQPEPGIAALWAHQETGHEVTDRRDRRVRAWAKARGIPFHEFPQNGVIRGLRSRDGWSRRWEERMRQPLWPEPPALVSVEGLQPQGLRWEADVAIAGSAKSEVQVGGESQGQAWLESFLSQRGRSYVQELSSPVTAEHACSRLSPYLAFGNLSLKQVVHAVARRQRALDQERRRRREVDPGWDLSLQAYRSRLHWHCHFMQKLEDEPSIEFENMNRAFDGLREGEFCSERFEAWCQGRTGYPMVDACMRALHRTGWIPFRMRAMLISFASHHLWLHWRPTALILARHFLDFEPGIHYSQVQMQSGTTGISTLRIYNPIKQVLDHDPDGCFLRRYLPELQGVPRAYLAQPHLMPAEVQSQAGCRIGRDYPRPIVEHAAAYQAAQRRLAAWRAKEGVSQASEQVAQRHGSRRRSSRWGRT